MSIRLAASQTPVLYTERLCLSRILPRDAWAMYAYSRQEKVTRYLTWRPHKSYFQTRRYIDLLQSKYDTAEFFDWGVRLKQNGRLIGTCGFTTLDEQSLSAEIGYVLSPRVWGKGYATEAACRVMRFGFEHLGLREMTARFIYGNDKSEAVMKRLGMKSRGWLPAPFLIKGKYRSVLEYRITREEFLNRSVQK